MTRRVATTVRDAIARWSSWGGSGRAVENARSASRELSRRRLERDEVQLFLQQETRLLEPVGEVSAAR